MFFHNIPLYLCILFIGITALECFLAIMLLRWDAWKRYPVMSAYLTWQAAGGLANLLIALFGTAMPYFFSYYVGTILLNLIAFAVALELYYKIFDPRIGLFAWGRRHVVIIISVSLAMAIMIGRLFAARNGGSLTRTMMTVNEVMTVALWATFCILCIYSRSLGFTWRPRVAGIAMGFILYLTVSVICIFISTRFSLSTALISNQLKATAEFLAMAWWLGVFWGEEKLPEEATSEQVEETVARYRKTVEEAAQLL
ncbi:MAG TPA: hypothetical protein VHW72_17545 [Candidatus Angelobacter sp.]|jgi:hypothetical protein|nr:hypothetical protein [Candidatus Angelobacter sp.]